MRENKEEFTDTWWFYLLMIFVAGIIVAFATYLS